MKNLLGRAAACGTALALLTGSVTGCWSTSPSDESDAPTRAEESSSLEPDGTTPAALELGCTGAILEYAKEHGLPEAEPQEQSTFEIPLVTLDTVPDCYLADQSTSEVRYAAAWTTEANGTLTSLASALNASGYTQSTDYGPFVWWHTGDGPGTAAHLVGASTEPLDDGTMVWATW